MLVVVINNKFLKSLIFLFIINDCVDADRTHDFIRTTSSSENQTIHFESSISGSYPRSMCDEYGGHWVPRTDDDITASLLLIDAWTLTLFDSFEGMTNGWEGENTYDRANILNWLPIAD